MNLNKRIKKVLSRYTVHKRGTDTRIWHNWLMFDPHTSAGKRLWAFPGFAVSPLLLLSPLPKRWEKNYITPGIRRRQVWELSGPFLTASQNIRNLKIWKAAKISTTGGKRGSRKGGSLQMDSSDTQVRQILYHPFQNYRFYSLTSKNGFSGFTT